MDNILPDLTNAEFTLGWNGKEYLVRKATIRQVLAYQKKIKELKGGEESDSKLIPFCLRLILGSQIGDVSDDQILDGMRGDIIGTQDDVMNFLATLGFMTPEKLEMGRRLQEAMIQKQTGQSSS